MNKRQWLIWVILPFFSSFFLDQIFKGLAQSFLETPVSYGWFHLELYKNYGVIFSIGSHLPPELKALILLTAAGFLFASFGMLQWILSRPYLHLRLGLSLLMAGILGNSFDHIVRGYALDYFALNLNIFKTAIFNFADVIQWLGFGFLIYSLIRYGKTFYPEKESRKRLFINPKFQYKFFLSFLIVTLGYSVVSGLFFVASLRVIMTDLSGEVRMDYLLSFVLAYLAIMSAFILLIMIFSLRISHKIIGPITAIERYLGGDEKLKIREGDETAHLEKIMSLIEKIKSS